MPWDYKCEVTKQDFVQRKELSVQDGRLGEKKWEAYPWPWQCWAPTPTMAVLFLESS